MWRRAAATGPVLAVAVTMGLLGVGPAAAVELTVSPASGPPGTEIVVTGSGFAALPVEIRFGGLSGPVIATAIGPAFAVRATVPDSPPNSVPVMAVVTNGNSVSTSSASFQVTSGEAPAETSTSTTVAEPPPTTPRSGIPGGETGQGAETGGPARSGGLSGGIAGGVDPEPARGTTNGGGASASPSTGTGAGAGSASASATATSTVTTVPTLAGVTTPTGAVTPPGAAVLPAGQSATPVPAAPTEGEAAGAIAPSRTSQSAGAVSNPALLFLGLGLVFAGGVFLAVRNRQPA